jgi:predicted amidohydrolase
MRVAALQMNAAAGDPAANLYRIERAAAEAAKERARLLVTPELAVTGYGAGEAFAELAEPADGPTARGLAALSQRYGIAVIAGFAERASEGVYNSALLVDGDRPPLVYRKSHLYGPYERRHFVPARPSAISFELDGLKCGMLICYDVEFPENVRRLAQAGVQLVLVPTALPASDHAELIARQMIAVRAFENQIFVAYVDHCGSDGRFAYAGLSTIAAPDGRLLAQAGTAEAMVFADIDSAAYAESMATNTYLADLRTA